MDIFTLVLLVLVCIVASGISALLGLAGGTIILTAFTFCFTLQQAVALHAAIQLISNASRIFLSLRQIRWAVAGWFGLLLLPFTYLGGLCFNLFNPDILEICIALFIIFTLFLPKTFQNAPSQNWWLVFLGALAGFLGMLVAATGPLISAFFNIKGLKKEALVATKAVCQGLSQLAKIIIFSQAIDFPYLNFSTEILIFGVAVILGAYIGNYYLRRISDNSYDKVNRIVLFSVALLMIGRIGIKWLVVSG